MNVETVKIDSLTFDPANVRKHDEKNLAAIKASLNRFGQQKPIVVDANGVVRAGNGTLAAAKALGWKEIRIVRSSLAGSEATAYAIADNRSAELAEWDDEALAQTLAALQIEDDALAEATGYTKTDIDKFALDMISNVEDEEEQEVEKPDQDGISVIVVMSLEQEALFREAIRSLKQRDEIKTTGDAIYLIIKEWLNGKDARSQVN